MYMSFKDLLQASKSASTKLSQIHQNLVKKIEAKRVELEQCNETIEGTEKANKDVLRKLDIQTHRNDNLEGSVNEIEEKLRAVYHECAVREHIITENAKKLQLSPRFEGLDQEAMINRVKKSQD